MRALVHKNFRHLSLERKIVFFAHILTMVGCFLPWIVKGDARNEFFFNGFQGETFLIGFSLFVLSFCVCVVFVDHLFDTKKIRLFCPEALFHSIVSIASLILAIIAWSVLWQVAGGYSGIYGFSGIRFGLFLIVIVQFLASLASLLLYKGSKKEEVQSFFQHPDTK